MKKMADMIVEVCEELQPQVAQISVGVGTHDRHTIEVKFVPKGDGPITITVPEGVRITLEKMASPITPQ